MSWEGWLMYGDRGPIIGKWPAEFIKAHQHRPLTAGMRVVIENGVIREAKGREYGPRLPDGASINGTEIDVPGWWYWLHFGELLRHEPPSRCCGEGGVSREDCGDCPAIYQPVTAQQEELFADVVNSKVPCWRGSLCNWPACRMDCDGRPGLPRRGA